MAKAAPDWRRSGRRGLVGLLLILIAPALAQAVQTVVQTVDESGRPLTGGSVVFCPLTADCLEFPIAADGTIALDRTRLEPGTTYTIIVYSVERSVRYAAFAWSYDPAAFQTTAGGSPVVPRLRGNDRQEIAWDFTPARDAATTAAAAAPRPEPPGPAPTRPFAWPRLVVGACVPFLLGGHFGVDDEALGGVTDVAPGFGAFVAYRFGYPASSPTGFTAVGFREVSLTYAANRYTVDQLGEPATSSDLTFHRLHLAFGVGRLTARTFMSGALAVGYGGIYDGSELLEYGGRTYGMVGVGFQGRYGYEVLGGDAHGLGIFGQLDLMYYPADSGESDHWYGLAPTLAAGVVVH